VFDGETKQMEDLVDRWVLSPEDYPNEVTILLRRPGALSRNGEYRKARVRKVKRGRLREDAGVQEKTGTIPIGGREKPTL